MNNFETIVICITIILITAIIVSATLYHQLTETPYEKCIDACMTTDCKKNCNDAVIEIIKDLTDSIDNLNWEEILE